MTTFSVVSTPIGNLGDITLRALEVLKNASILACEDTRVTRKLLSAHGIETTTKTFVSYHAHSKISKLDEIVTMLKNGENVVLVSDAGTPGISDPGTHLVAVVRRELKDMLQKGELKIEAIPGPSALVSALSIAGVPCADFVFIGFIPHKKGREKLFTEIADSKRTMIFYESPHRISKTLESLVKHLSGKNKTVTICRELTKIFEEVVAGSALEVKNYFDLNPDKVRGEFVVIVSS